MNSKSGVDPTKYYILARKNSIDPSIYSGPFNTEKEATDALMRGRTTYGRWVVLGSDITKGRK